MEIGNWMDAFAAAVRQAFGARVYCVGLQGSRARGEANEDSDIDEATNTEEAPDEAVDDDSEYDESSETYTEE